MFRKVRKSNHVYFVKKKDEDNNRTIHTFFMTSNLKDLKEDLLKTYDMYKKKSKKEFIKTNSIPLVKIRNVNVINFYIKFDKDKRRYRVNKDKRWEYSSKGAFSLGALFTSKEYTINHLGYMNLSTYEPMNESNQKSNTKSINTGDILKKRESDDKPKEVCDEKLRYKCGDDVVALWKVDTTKMKKNKG